MDPPLTVSQFPPGGGPGGPGGGVELHSQLKTPGECSKQCTSPDTRCSLGTANSFSLNK